MGRWKEILSGFKSFLKTEEMEQRQKNTPSTTPTERLSNVKKGKERLSERVLFLMKKTKQANPSFGALLNKETTITPEKSTKPKNP